MSSNKISKILTNRWRYFNHISKNKNRNAIILDIINSGMLITYLSNMDIFVENQYKLFYADADVTGTKVTIFLEFYKSFGYGDVVIGYKCLKNLREYLPPNIELVVVTSTINDVKRIAGDYIQKKQIPMIKTEDILDVVKNMDYSHAYLITFALETEICLEVHQMLKNRTMYVDEYNGWRANDISTKYLIVPGFGLQDNQLTSGINIYKNTEINIHKGFRNPNYYFGYISEEHAKTETLYKYLMYIILLNKNSGKKIDIVLLIPNPDIENIIFSLNKGIYCDVDSENLSSSVPNTSKKITESTPSELLKLDIHFEGVYTPEIDVVVIKDVSNNIQITIHKYMQHDMVLSRMKNSQEPILVTGDQSMSEAISLGKLFFYELQDWKIDLYKNFLDYCKFVLPRNTALHYFLDNSSNVNTLSENRLDKVIQDLVSKTKRSDLSRYMKTISDHIKDNMDLSMDLVATVKMMLVGTDKNNNHFKQLTKQIIQSNDSSSSNPRKRNVSISKSSSSKRQKVTTQSSKNDSESLSEMFCSIC